MVLCERASLCSCVVLDVVFTLLLLFRGYIGGGWLLYTLGSTLVKLIKVYRKSLNHFYVLRNVKALISAIYSQIVAFFNRTIYATRSRLLDYFVNFTSRIFYIMV